MGLRGVLSWRLMAAKQSPRKQHGLCYMAWPALILLLRHAWEVQHSESSSSSIMATLSEAASLSGRSVAGMNGHINTPILID